MLELSHVSRSTFQSWQKAGLDIASKSGAYGLSEVVTLAILALVRDFLQTREMVSIWKDLVASGEAGRMINAARKLKEGAAFDLVVEPRHASLKLALTDKQVVEAVHHSADPRPVVVVDASERIYTVVRTFNRVRITAPRRKARTPGRPRSVARNAEGNVVRIGGRDR